MEWWKKMFDFQTNTHGFRKLSFSEIKELEAGDKIVICTCWNPPKEARFDEATVVRPLFWNSDADEPDWEVETTNGFVDVHSIYEVTKL